MSRTIGEVAIWAFSSADRRRYGLSHVLDEGFKVCTTADIAHARKRLAAPAQDRRDDEATDEAVLHLQDPYATMTSYASVWCRTAVHIFHAARWDRVSRSVQRGP